MNHFSIKIHSLISLLSILLVGLEFGSYYFLNSVVPGILIAIFLNILLSHIYLEASLSFTSCFLQSLLTTILSTAAIILIYYYQTDSILVYQTTLLLFILLNWLVPFLFCIFRNLADRGPRFVSFRSAFWKMSLLFAVFYLFYFARHFFIIPAQFPESISNVTNPLIPLLATATYIEDSIYLSLKISPLLLFFAKSVLLFAPIGFYASILLKEASKIFIILLTLILPIGAACIPLAFEGVFYTDTFLFQLIGTLIGIMLYQICNHISNHNLHLDFLEERSRYRFFNLYY